MSKPLSQATCETLKETRNNNLVKSVNWHFTSRCNYHCTFCCKQNLDGDLTSIDKAERVLQHLIRLGMEKINFVGGEPFCHPLINDLIILAKKQGFTTSVTTNGSLLTHERLAILKGHLDWVGISIDSISEDVEKELGRGNGSHVSHAVKTAQLVQTFGMKLKINTTVTRMNVDEDMRPLISAISPDRWKIFQCLHVPGQNDNVISTLSITNDEFNQYQNRNSQFVLTNGTKPVFESSDEMLDSYFMISPSGNVIKNSKDRIEEIPISDVTLATLPEILNVGTYILRGAVYDWK